MAGILSSQQTGFSPVNMGQPLMGTPAPGSLTVATASGQPDPNSMATTANQSAAAMNSLGSTLPASSTTSATPQTNLGYPAQQTNTGNASSNYLQATNDSSVVPAAMYNDYQSFWKNTPVGGSVDFAGGKLTRLNTNGASNSENVGMYTNADGKQYSLTSNSDLTQAAMANPAIAAQWKQQYGFNPNQTTGQTSTASPYQGINLDPTKSINAMSAITPNTQNSTNAANQIDQGANPTDTSGILAGQKIAPYTVPSTSANSGIATGTTSQSSIAPNIQTDYQNYWKNTPVGQTVNWAGGTLTRDAFGSGTYTSPDGKTQTLTPTSNLNEVAQSNPNIAAQWTGQYGANGIANPIASTTQATSGAASTLSNPNQWNVTANQTTQGQLQNLLNPNSPLYQQWQQQGRDQAAARGFTGNSTIQDSAMYNAILQNATPIAGADAATYAKAAGYNADMPNQFAVANQNANNQLNIANISSGTQKYLSDQSAATQTNVTKMNNQSQQLISKAHDDNSVLLQNNSSASTAYNNYAATLANINGSTTMNGDAKATAIQTATNLYNAQITGIKNGTPATISPLDVNNTNPSKTAASAVGVDVSGQLNFGNEVHSVLGQ